MSIVAQCACLPDNVCMCGYGRRWWCECIFPITALAAMVHEPAVLIEGVLFRARYIGSTQLACETRGSKTARMAQAQEAVARVKVRILIIYEDITYIT